MAALLSDWRNVEVAYQFFATSCNRNFLGKRIGEPELVELGRWIGGIEAVVRRQVCLDLKHMGTESFELVTRLGTKVPVLPWPVSLANKARDNSAETVEKLTGPDYVFTMCMDLVDAMLRLARYATDAVVFGSWRARLFEGLLGIISCIKGPIDDMIHEGPSVTERLACPSLSASAIAVPWKRLGDAIDVPVTKRKRCRDEDASSGTGSDEDEEPPAKKTKGTKGTE